MWLWAVQWRDNVISVTTMHVLPKCPWTFGWTHVGSIRVTCGNLGPLWDPCGQAGRAEDRQSSFSKDIQSKGQIIPTQGQLIPTQLALHIINLDLVVCYKRVTGVLYCRYSNVTEIGRINSQTDNINKQVHPHDSANVLCDSFCKNFEDFSK